MAEQFQFDTFGCICIVDGPGQYDFREFYWFDLSPGVQGCIAAMLEEACQDRGFRAQWFIERGNLWPPGFSDLHPDTLARIIADWDDFLANPDFWRVDSVVNGRQFQEQRQRGEWGAHGFPPDTPYLSEDGKVCLRPSPSVAEEAAEICRKATVKGRIDILKRHT